MREKKLKCGTSSKYITVRYWTLKTPVCEISVRIESVGTLDILFCVTVNETNNENVSQSNRAPGLYKWVFKT